MVAMSPLSLYITWIRIIRINQECIRIFIMHSWNMREGRERERWKWVSGRGVHEAVSIQSNSNTMNLDRLWHCCIEQLSWTIHTHFLLSLLTVCVFYSIVFLYACTSIVSHLHHTVADEGSWDEMTVCLYWLFDCWRFLCYERKFKESSHWYMYMYSVYTHMHMYIMKRLRNIIREPPSQKDFSNCQQLRNRLARNWSQHIAT